MAYNFDKNTCDICNITKEDLLARINCVMSYAEKMQAGSFNLGQNGSVLCPDCHKENLLKKIIG
jgi:hypothetical protein